MSINLISRVKPHVKFPGMIPWLTLPQPDLNYLHFYFQYSPWRRTKGRLYFRRCCWWNTAKTASSKTIRWPKLQTLLWKNHENTTWIFKYLEKKYKNPPHNCIDGWRTLADFVYIFSSSFSAYTLENCTEISTNLSFLFLVDRHLGSTVHHVTCGKWSGREGLDLDTRTRLDNKQDGGRYVETFPLISSYLSSFSINTTLISKIPLELYNRDI